MAFPYTHCILCLCPVHGLPLAPIQKRPMGEPAVDAGPPIPNQRKPHTVSTTHQWNEFGKNLAKTLFTHILRSLGARHGRIQTKRCNTGHTMTTCNPHVQTQLESLGIAWLTNVWPPRASPRGIWNLVLLEEKEAPCPDKFGKQKYKAAIII